MRSPLLTGFQLPGAVTALLVQLSQCVCRPGVVSADIPASLTCIGGTWPVLGQYSAADQARAAQAANLPSVFSHFLKTSTSQAARKDSISMEQKLAW